MPSQITTEKSSAWLIILTILVIVVLAGCQVSSATIPTATIILPSATNPLPTATPTLPPGTIRLEIVDVSQVSTTMPVHRQLLVVSQSDLAYTTYDGTYEIGLLDLENARFIRLQRIKSYPPYSIEWKPDGTQFIYGTRGIGDSAISFYVIGVDGQLLFRGSWARWLQNGRYLAAVICEASRLSGSGTVWAVYDTTSWKEVCQICRGRDWGMDCTSRCQQSCLPISGTDFIDPEPTSEPPRRRYQVSIEDGRLIRIIDTETSTEKNYVIAGYHIREVAWSPD